MSNQWFVRSGNDTIGPIPTAKLKQLASTGQLQPTDLIRKEEMANYVPAARVKGLFPEAAAPLSVIAAETMPADVGSPSVAEPVARGTPCTAGTKRGSFNLLVKLAVAGIALIAAAALGAVVMVLIQKPTPDPDPKANPAAVGSDMGVAKNKRSSPSNAGDTSADAEDIVDGEKSRSVSPGTGAVSAAFNDAVAAQQNRSATTNARRTGPDWNDAWTVLDLVSLDYVLEGKPHPRDHSLPPYVPLLASRNPAAREVAALSAVWEIYVWKLQGAHQRRVSSVMNFFPGMKAPRPRGAAPDPTPPAVPANLMTALTRAKREGVLTAYRKVDIWPEVQKVIEEKNADLLAELSQASANYYNVRLKVGRMQAILWNRAEALAKSAVNGNNNRGADVEVKSVFERGKRWGSVIVRNKSASDLEHVTFVVTAPMKPLPPGTPGLDFVLGAGVTSEVRGNDPVRNVAAGSNLAGAVANDRAAREMPLRRFVHVPKLAPGAECEVKVFGSSFEFARTQSAVYSLWADGIISEGQPFPGYDAVKEEIRLLTEQAKNQTSPQPQDRGLAASRSRPAPANNGGGDKGVLILKTSRPIGSGVKAWIEINGIKKARWKVGDTEVQLPLPAGTYRVGVYSIYRAMKNTVYYNEEVSIGAGESKKVQVGP